MASKKGIMAYTVVRATKDDRSFMQIAALDRKQSLSFLICTLLLIHSVPSNHAWAVRALTRAWIALFQALHGYRKTILTESMPGVCGRNTQ